MWSLRILHCPKTPQKKYPSILFGPTHSPIQPPARDSQPHLPPTRMWPEKVSRLLSSLSAIRVSINDDKKPWNTNYLGFAVRDERDFGARPTSVLVKRLKRNSKMPSIEGSLLGTRVGSQARPHCKFHAEHWGSNVDSILLGPNGVHYRAFCKCCVDHLSPFFSFGSRLLNQNREDHRKSNLQLFSRDWNHRRACSSQRWPSILLALWWIKQVANQFFLLRKSRRRIKGILFRWVRSRRAYISNSCVQQLTLKMRRSEGDRSFNQMRAGEPR